jgi:CRP-like cAMP-binding protein
MFDELPESLALELSVSLKEELIVKVPLFAACQPLTILHIIGLLESVITLPKEVVMRQGEVGQCMYFALRGRLEVCHRDDTSGGEIVVNFLDTGDAFGQRSVFDVSGLITATVRSLTFCELELLPLANVRELMKLDKALQTSLKAEARAEYTRDHRTVECLQVTGRGRSAGVDRRSARRKSVKIMSTLKDTAKGSTVGQLLGGWTKGSTGGKNSQKVGPFGD